MVLTGFRYRKFDSVDDDASLDFLANKTHPCDSHNDEYLCSSRECISGLLKCDGKLF